MATPKTELMRRLRQRRLRRGLVEVRVWVRPENVDAVKQLDQSKEADK